MLFGDRINRLTLHESLPLIPGALTDIYRLAEEMGLILIDDEA